jgi:hypothetical protein
MPKVPKLKNLGAIHTLSDMSWHSAQLRKRTDNFTLRTWKKVALVSCKVLPGHLPEGTEKNHKKPQLRSLVPQRKFKFIPQGSLSSHEKVTFFRNDNLCKIFDLK